MREKKEKQILGVLEQIERIGRINPTLPQAVTESGMEAKAALIVAGKPGNRGFRGDGGQSRLKPIYRLDWVDFTAQPH